MRSVRRLVPVLALLLGAVVFVQATDLVGCADEATLVVDSGTHQDVAGGAHPASVPGTSHDDVPTHDAALDCYCHVVFAPTGARVDAAVGRTATSADFAVFVAAPTSGTDDGLDPVPLA